MPEPSLSHRISLGDHVFHVRVQSSQIAYYDRIAKYAQATYDDIRKQGFKADQAMAMAAFQIAIAFFESRDEVHEIHVDRERVERLVGRIDEALAGRFERKPDPDAEPAAAGAAGNGRDSD